MTSRFNLANFHKLTSDGSSLSIFSAKSKNLRWNVPVEKIITLGAADAHNLPGIAHRYLGDMHLWWVLLEFNGLYSAIEDVQAGTILRIPSRSALITYLETTPDRPSNVVL